MSNGTILISPYAQKLRNGKENPKNFPYWGSLVNKMIDCGFDVIQIGSSKDSKIDYGMITHHDHLGTFSFKSNLKLKEIVDLVEKCNTWISVDSFLPHLNHYYSRKPGIVIFSQSDPRIFGYNENNNLLKDRKYLRENMFWLWEQATYDADAFVSAEEVVVEVKRLLA